MRPAEMVYTAMKVNEWTEKIEQEEMWENTRRRKTNRREKQKQREERNEALRNMLNRK